MTLDDLIAQFRVDSGDKLEPYLCTDEEVTAWLDEAQDEAAIRARLLHESTLADLCQIPVTAGVHTYTLHRLMGELSYVGWMAEGDSRVVELELVSREDLDARKPGWRQRNDRVAFAIQDDTRIRLAYTPAVPGVLTLEGYRRPLKSLEMSGKPEIGDIHHRHLVHWALYRCFDRPDAELFDADRAAREQAAFTKVFGLRPDADARRSTRHDQHQTNQAWVL